MGQVQRGLESEAEGGVHMGGGDQLHALQGLQSALGLTGLGGLGPEALDEAVDVRHLALLTLVGRLLLGEPLGALALEGGIVPRIEGQSLALQVQGVLHHRVQEVPVVGDQDQGAPIGLEPALQPDDRVQVQVVGGLVEQEQVRAAHQGARQGEPHTPTAGIAVDRPTLVARGEPEPMEQPSRPTLGPVAVDGLQSARQLPVAQPVARGVRRRQIRLDATQLRVPVQDKLDGRLLTVRGVLGHMGQLPTGRDGAIPRVRVELPAQEREQARLAAAIRPHEPDLLARIDGERGPGQQQARSASER